MFRLRQKWKFGLAIGALLAALVYFSAAAERSPHPTWYQRWSQKAVAPGAKALSSASSWVQTRFGEYLVLSGAKQENLALKGRVQELEAELLKAREENRGMKAAENLFAESGFAKAEAKAARVIGYDPVSVFRSITIDRGTEDGVAPDQAVVSGGGVIGRVMKAGNRNSQVLLVTDLNSSVDVLDARTRARGLLVGKRQELGLRRERWLTQAEYVSSSEEIRSGDLLLTSGLDGVFPKGLPVGVVSRVKKDDSGLFWQAEVEP